MLRLLTRTHSVHPFIRALPENQASSVSIECDFRIMFTLIGRKLFYFVSPLFFSSSPFCFCSDTRKLSSQRRILNRHKKPSYKQSSRRRKTKHEVQNVYSFYFLQSGWWEPLNSVHCTHTLWYTQCLNFCPYYTRSRVCCCCKPNIVYELLCAVYSTWNIHLVWLIIR